MKQQRWRRLVGVGLSVGTMILLLGACGSGDDGGENAGGEAGNAASAGAAGQMVGGEAGALPGGAGHGGGGQAGHGPGGGGSHQGGGAGVAGTGGQAGGGQAGTAAAGQGGQAGGIHCPQESGEPNDIESTAFPLPDITDCDKKDTRTVKGALDPLDDDWYTWHAKDATGCLVDPTFVRKSPHNLTMCVFFHCDKGKTVVTCPSGADEKTSVNGRPGCCSSNTELKPKLECKGTSSEDAWVWLHVGWKDNSECIPYEIEYHQ